MFGLIWSLGSPAWARIGAVRGGRVIAVVAAAAALVVAIVPAAASARTDWLSERVLNIAHQGGENEAPSNTMYALIRAMRLGSDMLELDIHTSADGEIVVIHDATVNRTTNGSGAVYDKTYEEIRALDAGFKLVPGEGARDGRPQSDYPFRGVRTGERKPPPSMGPEDFTIPTLDEVIQAFPGVPLNIEIKGASDEDVGSFLRNAEALATYLNELGRTDGIIVASFNDAALQRFHELAPQIDLAPATGEVASYVATRGTLLEGRTTFQVPPEFGGVTVADEQFIEDAHEDGYAVHVWTINEEEAMRELIGFGVEGVMTARPSRLERVLCRDDVVRPDRPEEFRGSHCGRRTSLACEVDATGATVRGKRLNVELVRRDGFDGRCAGRLAFNPAGVRGRKSGRFNFGNIGTDMGGRTEEVVSYRLGKKLRRKLARRDAIQLMIHPYGAFVAREKLEL